MDKHMHWKWFGTFLLEAGAPPEEADTGGRVNQMVDDSTHANYSGDTVLLGPTPVETQGEVASGVYALAVKGHTATIDRIIRFHFPNIGGWAKPGPCMPPDASRFTALAYDYMTRLQSMLDRLDALVGLSIEGHRLMDMHTHQGFTGYACAKNANTDYKAKRKKGTKCPMKQRLVAWLTPNKMALGHAEYLHDPDTVGAQWKRKGKLIDNQRRFLDCGALMWNALRPDRKVVWDEERGAYMCARPGTEFPRCLRLLESTRDGEVLDRVCDELWLTLAHSARPGYTTLAISDPVWPLFCAGAREVLRLP